MLCKITQKTYLDFVKSTASLAVVVSAGEDAATVVSLRLEAYRQHVSHYDNANLIPQFFIRESEPESPTESEAVRFEHGNDEVLCGEVPRSELAFPNLRLLMWLREGRSYCVKWRRGRAMKSCAEQESSQRRQRRQARRRKQSLARSRRRREGQLGVKRER
ncbi:hypothetical protein E2542_SST04874 [Spatholobus suberectus]|nr:hypothetical protein E2542_SST04874 [Spatholobus suberectus]